MGFKKRPYSFAEELMNSITHGIGTVMSIVFLVVLIVKSSYLGDVRKIVGFSIYGATLILMFLFSTLYHSITNLKAKSVLRVFDHSAIFLTIAGSYTPIALIGLPKTKGMWILIAVWTIALIGIIMKIIGFSLGKAKKIEVFSLVLYLGMGWLSLFLIGEIIRSIGFKFFLYLLLGGLSYTIGVYFYRNDKIKYNHAIWHLWIMSGAIFMFVGMYKYLL